MSYEKGNRNQTFKAKEAAGANTWKAERVACLGNYK